MDVKDKNFYMYLKWRGDLSFQNDKFNKVDALILSYLSYCNYENILTKNMSIENVSYKYFKKYSFEEIDAKYFVFKNSPYLLQAVGQTERFKNLKMSNYVNILNIENEIQFSALTFEIDENNIFVAFRGTDENLVGWKEDCYLAVKDVIPSQLEALNYINSLSNIQNKNIYIGGHSKGGNLAIYASAMCKNEIKEKIVNIFSFDNPGFLNNFIESEEFKSIENKLLHFIPKNSFVSMFFENPNNKIFIDCAIEGLKQHDPYYWNVLGNNFVKSDILDFKSILFKESIDGILMKYSKNDIKEIVDGIFQVFNDVNITKTYELQSINITKVTEILKVKNNLSPKTKEIIFEAIKFLIQTIIPKKK